MSRRRIVLIVLAGAVLTLAYFGWQWMRVSAARQAIARLGGSIYDKSPHGLKVSFTGKTLQDSDLAVLAPLTNLTQLDLGMPSIIGEGITDSGLKHLASLTQLTALNLANRNITPAGLKELAHLQGLTSLNLAGTRITDAGLKELVLQRYPGLSVVGHSID